MSRRYPFPACRFPAFRGVSAAVPFVLAVGFALLLGAVLAGCDTAGSSDTGNVAITGRVTDGDGNGVDNARLEVTVPGEEGGDNMFTAHTDTSGTYRLEVDVPSSMEVTMQVFSDEMSAEKVLTVLPEEDRSNVNFVLGEEGSGGENVSLATLAGRVATVEDEPLPNNARIVATGGAAGSGGPHTTPVDSSTGRYELEVPVKGSTELTLEARSDELTAQRVVTVFPEETRAGVNFTLGSGTFTVNGRVTDGDDNALANVRVEVPTNGQTAGDQTFTTQTGDDGAYTLDVDLTASTELTVRAVSDELSDDQVVTAFPDEERSGVNLVLGNSTATISGRVTDGDDSGVKGARVEAQANGQTFTAETGSDGTYTLTVQIASSTDLTVRAVSDDLSAEQTVTLFPGDDRSGVDFVLGTSTAALEGTVTDGDGNGVGGARVETQAAGETFSTQTDGSGNYALDVGITGTTDLTVRAVSDGQTAEQTVTVFPKETRSDINFVLGSTATITGRATDAGGAALPDARVEATAGGETFTTQTGSNGNYTLSVPVASATDLTVRAVNDGQTAEQTVSVAPGETESDVNFQLGTSEATISGQVTDVSDSGVSNVRVEAQAAGETFTARTGGSGNYTLEVQIASSTDLTVRAVDDEKTAEQTVTLFPGESRQNVDFTLGGSAFTISGKVTDGDGGALPNVRVEVPANAQTVGGETFTAQTGDDGTYSLDVALTTSTELTVRAVSDELTAEQTVTAFPGDDRSGIDFVLGSSTGGGTGIIEGQVTDGNGNALAEARVEVPDAEQTIGSQPFTTLTSEDGTYSLDVELRSSAELTVRAVSDDRQTEQLVTVVPGDTIENVDLVLGSSTGEGTATVTGRVTDSENNPVENARIEVPASEQTIGDQPFTTLTDANGEYDLEVDLRSSAEVEMSAFRDDLSATKTVTLVPDEERSEVNFVLGGSADNSGTATIEGRVLNGNGDPVTNAQVAALSNEQTVSDQPVTTSTDGDGAYTLEVEITSSTDLTMQASSDGRNAEQIVTVFPDEPRSGIDFSFDDGGDDGDGGEESGTPSNVLLLNVSRPTIGIQGSGSPETSEITYQVADSAGNPVSLDNETPVQFELSGASPQGASIAPPEATTNDQGKVTANLSSGTDAGTAQIVASVDDGEGDPITSKPVSVTIHGGLPVAENFHLRSSQTNVAAGADSRDVTVNVEVGDQYNNPVKPETAVYFTTTDGIIEGSIQTDERGRGSAELSLAGASAGEVVTATAETANRDEQTISTETGVFLSGASTIELDTTGAELGRTYQLTVADANGYPLAPGTTISVEAEGTKVKAVGNTDVTLDDYGFSGDAFTTSNIRRGEGITEFTFKAVDDLQPDEGGNPTLETITVTVTSPNGDLETVLTNDPSSGGNLTTTTKDATVEVRADGSAVVQK